MVTTEAKVIPEEIGQFFNALYHRAPDVEKDKKNNSIYSIPGGGVSIIADSYGGCHIDIKEVSPEHYAVTKEVIHQLSETYRNSRAFDSIWVDFKRPLLPRLFGSILPDSFQIGEENKCDQIRDFQENKEKVWQWLNSDKPCTIPHGATHNIGAVALIIDKQAEKVLLVVDARRSGWNLPGGSYEPKDNTPSGTALREAQEEGGFELGSEVKKSAIQNAALVGQMQFPSNQFAPGINQIWAFFIDGISQTQLTPPPSEIKLAKWADFKAIQESDGTLDGHKLSEEIKTPLLNAINGLGFKEIANNGRKIVHA